MSDIIRFYRGECGNGSGDTFDDILTWGDDKLEVDHDYIQWLFPSNEQSMLNSDAPVFTRDDETKFHDDPSLRYRQQQAFERMMDFYGYDVEVNEDTGNVAIIPREPQPGEPHPQYALHGFNHNMLRITRILKSMRLTGNGEYALPLLQALQNLDPGVSPNTWRHWYAATHGDLWDGTSQRKKQIPGDLGTVTARYSMEKNNEELSPQQPKPNNLTSQDVVKTGTDIGKDVLKQSAVWVLAGALTKIVRQAVEGVVNRNKPAS